VCVLRAFSPLNRVNYGWFIAVLCLCIFYTISLLFVVSSSAIDCLERLAFEVFILIHSTHEEDETPYHFFGQLLCQDDGYHT